MKGGLGKNYTSPKGIKNPVTPGVQQSTKNFSQKSTYANTRDSADENEGSMVSSSRSINKNSQSNKIMTKNLDTNSSTKKPPKSDSKIANANFFKTNDDSGDSNIGGARNRQAKKGIMVTTGDESKNRHEKTLSLTSTSQYVNDSKDITKDTRDTTSYNNTDKNYRDNVLDEIDENDDSATKKPILKNPGSPGKKDAKNVSFTPLDSTPLKDITQAEVESSPGKKPPKQFSEVKRSASGKFEVTSLEEYLRNNNRYCLRGEVTQRDRILEVKTDLLDKRTEELRYKSETQKLRSKEIRTKTDEVREINATLAKTQSELKEATGELEVTNAGLEETSKKLQETSKKLSEVIQNDTEKEGNLTDALKDLGNKNTRLEKLTAEFDTLQGSYTMLTKDLNKKEKELEQKIKDINKKDQSITKKDEQIQSKDATLKEIKSDLKNTQNQIKVRVSELNDKNEEIKRLVGQLNESKQKSANLTKELDLTTKNLETKTGELKETSDQLKTALLDIKKKISNIEKLQSDNERLKENLDNVKGDLQEAKQTINEKKSEISTKNEEIKVQKQDLNTTQNNNAELTNNLETTTANLNEKTNDLKKTNDELKSSLADGKQKASKIEKMNAETDKLNKNQDNLKDQYNDKDKTLKEKFKEINQKGDTIKKNEDYIEKKNTECSNLTTELQKTKSELNTRIDEIADLSGTLVSTEQELQDTKFTANKLDKSLKLNIENLSEKTQVLKLTQKEKSELQKDVARKEKDITKLEKDLNKKTNDFEKKENDLKKLQGDFGGQSTILKSNLTLNENLCLNLQKASDFNKKAACRTFLKAFNKKKLRSIFLKLKNAQSKHEQFQNRMKTVFEQALQVRKAYFYRNLIRATDTQLRSLALSKLTKTVYIMQLSKQTEAFNIFRTYMSTQNLSLNKLVKLIKARIDNKQRNYIKRMKYNVTRLNGYKKMSQILQKIEKNRIQNNFNFQNYHFDKILLNDDRKLETKHTIGNLLDNKKKDLILIKLLLKQQMTMKDVYNKMGAMIFAHRSAFNFGMSLKKIFAEKKRDFFMKIGFYGRMKMEWVRAERHKRIKLRFFGFWTDAAMQGSFYKLIKRTNKIQRLKDMVKIFENLVSRRWVISMADIAERSVLVKKQNEAKNCMSVIFKHIYNNHTSHSTYVFGKMKKILYNHHRAIKFCDSLDQIGIIYQRKPFFFIRLIMDMIKIKKKRKRVLHTMIPKMAFNLKQLKLETMRIIKINSQQTSNFDRMCILLCKIAKEKQRDPYAAIYQAWMDFIELQRKSELYEKVIGKLMYRKMLLKKRYLKKLRNFHLQAIFIHRGLHILNVLLEKKKSDAFYTVQELYQNAPEEYWDWQKKGKKGMLGKIYGFYRRYSR